MKMRKCKALACAVALVGLAAHAQAAVTTVGALNPGPTGGGFIGFSDSPANVGNASFVTKASMTTIVSNAFNNNTGGVVNFEVGNGWVTGTNVPSFDATYGTGGTQTLTVTQGGGANMASFDATTGGAVPANSVASGNSYVGFTAQSPSWTFSKGLVDWGMFIVNRAAARTAQLTFTLQDTSTIVYTVDTLNSGGPDVWFGVQASAVNPIVGVTMTQAAGFASWDDMAFVVAVPEPGTLGLFGSLAGLVAIRRRGRN